LAEDAPNTSAFVAFAAFWDGEDRCYLLEGCTEANVVRTAVHSLARRWFGCDLMGATTQYKPEEENRLIASAMNNIKAKMHHT
jgi:hypothetical protein